MGGLAPARGARVCRGRKFVLSCIWGVRVRSGSDRKGCGTCRRRGAIAGQRQADDMVSVTGGQALHHWRGRGGRGVGRRLCLRGGGRKNDRAAVRRAARTRSTALIGAARGRAWPQVWGGGVGFG